MQEIIFGAWMLIRYFWIVLLLGIALLFLLYKLFKITLFGDGGIEIKTYNADNPKDRKKLHEIVQGGPNERYIDHGML